MERQSGGVHKPWGPHFDEFLTTRPGLEQMGPCLQGCAASLRLAHTHSHTPTPIHPFNQLLLTK